MRFGLSCCCLQATTRVGGHGERIAQCKEAVLVTRKALPMQVDGGTHAYPFKRNLGI